MKSIPYVSSVPLREMKMPDVPTAWAGLEGVLAEVVARYCPRHDLAIDFGVWYGFSTAALAQCFDQVIGVDTFEGDEDAGRPADLQMVATATMKAYPNVFLAPAHYRSFINGCDDLLFDLIHIDISHDYESTHELGRWSCAHAGVVLFHDTESFATVRQAVSDLADETGRIFYNYPHHHGLGILVNA